MACRESVEGYKQRGMQVEFLEACSSGTSIHDWPPEHSGISCETDCSQRKAIILVGPHSNMHAGNITSKGHGVPYD